MSGVVLVARPSRALDTVRLLGEEVANSTLVWSDGDALRTVSTELNAAGWDALAVRVDDQDFSGAAMGHRTQLHGVADVVVAVADSTDDIDDVIGVVRLVVQHLPHEVPVLLTGAAMNDLLKAWSPIAEEMEVVQTALAPEEDLTAMCRGAGKTAHGEG